MSLWYVDLLSCGCAPTLCLAMGFVAIFPVLRTPACSGCAGSCGFSSPILFATFAMGSPLRGRGWCGPQSERRFAPFLFPIWLILRSGVTLWFETVFDLILDRNEPFCISLGVVQGLHGGLPNSGACWRWASAPVRPGGLFSVLMPLSFGLQSPYGSSVLVGSHLYTTGGCYLYLALYPSGWASCLCLWLLFAPCYCRRVSWWSSLRPRVFGSSWLSPVFFPIR